jgi:DNA mismatch repair protein MutL
MSDIIQILSDQVANQIAAGEVIKRPAGVVKELMENSIDAGATSIQVVIKESGKTHIQVIDNGCGMTPNDAVTCFGRHATSKIRKAEDIFDIRTKGFRGEALASMAAVAQVELKTKRVEDETGWQVTLENSEVKTQGEVTAADGTSISVRNLFYNIPVQKKHLKSDAAEMRNIVIAFQRIALGHPGIFFSLMHNGSEIMHLEEGNLRQRIVGIFGNNHNQRLVPIEESTDVVEVGGFIGKPEFAKKTRGDSVILVNDRYVHSNAIHHAIMSGYEALLADQTYPFYMITLRIDPSKLDINVHPTKEEIHFEEEKVVYTIVHAAVRRALAQHSVTPTIDFDQERGFQDLEGFTSQAPPPSSVAEQPLPTAPRAVAEQDAAPEELQTMVIPSELSELVENDDPAEGKAKDKLPFQVHNRFIFSPIKSGFILIDQQSAHERVLFEKYYAAITEQKKVSQKQLFPVTITLSLADATLLQELMEEVQALGFDIQEFGKESFVIRGMPADIRAGNEQEIIENLLEQFKVYQTELKLEARESLARVMAKQASVKKGQRMGIEEMTNLIDELFACDVPNIGPNGKLTFITFSVEELAKQFDKS